jgi:hypothetical protein
MKISVRNKTLIISVIILLLLILLPIVYSQVGTGVKRGFGVWLIISNAGPIVKLNNVTIGAIDPVAAGAVKVIISFNVTDSNGVVDINATKAVLNFSRGGADGAQFRYNASADSGTELGTCYNHTQGTTVIINCTIWMYYYDNASTWNITATVKDLSGAVGRNNSITFTYNSLASFSVTSRISKESANINFTSLSLGDQNQEAKAPLLLNNSGNNDFDQINITAANLIGVSDSGYSIAATAFQVNSTNASKIDTNAAGGRGKPLAVTTITIPARDQPAADSVNNLTLYHGASSTGDTSAPYSDETLAKGNQTLIFWVDVPGSALITQAYNNTWNISVVDLN